MRVDIQENEIYVHEPYHLCHHTVYEKILI